MAKKSKQREPIWLVAVLLAWLVPGAGHAYIGRRRRGLVIGIALAATFWSGVAMGGVMTVDPVYERWWWTAQMLTGAHGLISWQRTEGVYDEIRQDEHFQDFAKTRKLRRDDDGEVVFVPAPAGKVDAVKMEVDQVLADRPGGSLAPGNPTAGIARAYSGIAGMLNLLCIFDVLMLAIMGLGREGAAAVVAEKGAKP